LKSISFLLATTYEVCIFSAFVGIAINMHMDKME
jgi:hypothetical protein